MKKDFCKKGQLYVFATEFEAEIPLAKTSAAIFITGIAPIPASIALAAHLAKNSYDEVINIGFAGSLKEGQKFGEFFEIKEVGKKYYPILPLTTHKQFPLASLYTSDIPIHSRIIRERLSLHYDLVDMEGWALAWTCRHLNIPCRFIKVVSDFCSKTTTKEIEEKGKELSKLIYTTIFC